MPAHKNQHFVPRCALKPFSLDGAGLAINLCNIARKRAVQNAPVKGQCARDYFYGKDSLRTEKLLAGLEGHYSRIVAHLSEDGALSDDDKEWLRAFGLVQVRRTELAIQQMRDMGESLADTVYARAPDLRPEDTRTDARLMRESLRYAAQFLDYVKDLKITIFRNRTTIDFITCDHPAVMTNRFHFQKLHSNHFGVSNSGAMLSSPLSPRLSAILYDGLVYSLPNASGTPFIDIKKSEDVEAINELQFLSASKNIYFKRWEDAENIANKVQALSDKRSKVASKATVYIRDDEADPKLGRVVRLRDPDTVKLKNIARGLPRKR